MGVHLLQSPQNLCVCNLEGSVHGVTGGFLGSVCVQPVKPGIKVIKAVWKGGISGVWGRHGSPVIRSCLDSLPHAARVVVQVEAFKFLGVGPFCSCDGPLKVIPGSL